MAIQDNKLGSMDTYKEDKAVELLNQLIPESIVKDQSLYIKSLDLEIGVSVPYVNGMLVQTVFTLKHKLFQEELMEPVVGTGTTFEEALLSSIVVFKDSVLNSIIKALKDEEGKELEVMLPGKKNTFKVYKSEVLIQGRKEEGGGEDFWSLLGEEISRCVGNKRVYLVKIYAAKTGEAVNCECRINGMIYPKLSRALSQRAAQWKAEGAIYSERQCFTLIQGAEADQSYPFTKKEVESHTMKALLLYRDCKSQEDYEKLYEKLCDTCGHPSLAAELVTIIPEIFTEIIFSEVSYSDELMLIKGNERMHMYKHQLTSYDWIYSVVDRTIRAGYFTKEQVDPIIYRSASLNAINDALSKGSKRENLSVLGVALPVPLEYQIL